MPGGLRAPKRSLGYHALDGQQRRGAQRAAFTYGGGQQWPD
jgi:hypothetical protein